MNLDRLFSIFRISGSGLSAQRKFINATASNIANIESIDTETGQPYTPKRVNFRETKIGNSFGNIFNSVMSRSGNSSGGSWRRTIPIGQRDWRSMLPRSQSGSGNMSTGVEAVDILENKNPYKMVYDPDNPNADDEGYVRKPNISLIKEMTNMMVASRAYEANVTVMNAAKGMMKKALEI